MVRLILMVLSVYVCQTTLSQVNLNLDIDARQLTHMKLSDISEESRYVALKMDSIVDFFATDNFLFVSTGGFFSTKLHQYDFSGNLLQIIFYLFLQEGFFQPNCINTTFLAILFEQPTMIKSLVSW